MKLENNILLCDLGLIVCFSGNVKRTSIPPRQRKHSRITAALVFVLKLVAFSPRIVRISENLIKTHRPHSFNSMNECIVQTKIGRCMPNQLPPKTNHSSWMQHSRGRKFRRIRNIQRISQLALLILGLFLLLFLECRWVGKRNVSLTDFDFVLFHVILPRRRSSFRRSTKEFKHSKFIRSLPIDRIFPLIILIFLKTQRNPTLSDCTILEFQLPLGILKCVLKTE
mmetsp:Transcript_9835/g.14039  ORF Transcript_9835/g.14039 Transcript_9835/m.14039 type:complete len:225 (+) Transcript_9835:2961-3635(+)